MPDGSEYIGEFHEGLQHGEGILTMSDGTELYGYWFYGIYKGENEPEYTKEK